MLAHLLKLDLACIKHMGHLIKYKLKNQHMQQNVINKNHKLNIQVKINKTVSFQLA